MLPLHHVISCATLLPDHSVPGQIFAISLDFCCSEQFDATKNQSAFYRSLRSVWNSTDLLVASLHWEIRIMYVYIYTYTYVFLPFFPHVHSAIPSKPPTAKFLWEPLEFGIWTPFRGLSTGSPLSSYWLFQRTSQTMSFFPFTPCFSSLQRNLPSPASGYGKYQYLNGGTTGWCSGRPWQEVIFSKKLSLFSFSKTKAVERQVF